MLLKGHRSFLLKRLEQIELVSNETFLSLHYSVAPLVEFDLNCFLNRPDSLQNSIVLTINRDALTLLYYSNGELTIVDHSIESLQCCPIIITTAEHD